MEPTPPRMKPRGVSPWVKDSARAWALLPPAQTGISNLNWEAFLQSKDGRICPKTHRQAARKPAGLRDTSLGTVSVNSGHK